MDLVRAGAERAKTVIPFAYCADGCSQREQRFAARRNPTFEAGLPGPSWGGNPWLCLAEPHPASYHASNFGPEEIAHGPGLGPQSR